MTEEIYEKPENEILSFFIREEMKKNQFDEKTDLPAVVRKKFIFTCIFAVLTFAFVSAYFFHFRRNICWLEIVNIIVFYMFMKKFNTLSYLIKEVKSRPDEEIAYIVSSIVSGAEKTKKAKTAKRVRKAVVLVSVILPLLIFMKPHTMYERTEEGYYVRFYTRGLLQDEEVEIPAEHRGEPVVGIRGNVFARLPGVDTIILPDTIDIIRGYAFAGSEDLTTVVMPSTLSYLGGNAFMDCRLLENVTLPEGLTEVRGSTFENCQYLGKIVIPEGVTRIGGHAFHNCMFLEDVTFPSTLKEIGSSAFRDCPYLERAEVPSGTSVNERAFKDSPTEIVYFD